MRYLIRKHETQSDKNWERNCQPHAAAQTLGFRGVRVKLRSIHFERLSIELNTVQPSILVKNLYSNDAQ